MKHTLGQIFRSQARARGNQHAVSKRSQNVWHTLTWDEYYKAVKETGLGLYALGIKKGDRVSILSQNRLEWIISDMASSVLAG